MSLFLLDCEKFKRAWQAERSRGKVGWVEGREEEREEARNQGNKERRETSTEMSYCKELTK